MLKQITHPIEDLHLINEAIEHAIAHGYELRAQCACPGCWVKRMDAIHLLGYTCAWNIVYNSVSVLHSIGYKWECSWIHNYSKSLVGASKIAPSLYMSLFKTLWNPWNDPPVHEHQPWNGVKTTGGCRWVLTGDPKPWDGQTFDD